MLCLKANGRVIMFSHKHIVTIGIHNQTDQRAKEIVDGILRALDSHNIKYDGDTIQRVEKP